LILVVLVTQLTAGADTSIPNKTNLLMWSKHSFQRLKKTQRYFDFIRRSASHCARMHQGSGGQAQYDDERHIERNETKPVFFTSWGRVRSGRGPAPSRWSEVEMLPH